MTAFLDEVRDDSSHCFCFRTKSSRYRPRVTLRHRQEDLFAFAAIALAFKITIGNRCAL